MVNPAGDFQCLGAIVIVGDSDSRAEQIDAAIRDLLRTADTGGVLPTVYDAIHRAGAVCFVAGVRSPEPHLHRDIRRVPELTLAVLRNLYSVLYVLVVGRKSRAVHLLTTYLEEGQGAIFLRHKSEVAKLQDATSADYRIAYIKSVVGDISNLCPVLRKRYSVVYDGKGDFIPLLAQHDGAIYEADVL